MFLWFVMLLFRNKQKKTTRTETGFWLKWGNLVGTTVKEHAFCVQVRHRVWMMSTFISSGKLRSCWTSTKKKKFLQSWDKQRHCRMFFLLFVFPVVSKCLFHITVAICWDLLTYLLSPHILSFELWSRATLRH